MAHSWAEAHHWAQCYSLNKRICHWCKVASFHWTTLMQDTLDITGAVTITILYDCILVILCLYSESIQHRFIAVV